MPNTAITAVKDSSLFKSVTALTPHDLSMFKWAAAGTAASVSAGALMAGVGALGILNQVRDIKKLKEHELALQEEQLKVERQTLSAVQDVKEEVKEQSEALRRFQLHRAFVQDRDYAIDLDRDDGQLFVVGARTLAYSRPDKVRVWQACQTIMAPRVTVLAALECKAGQSTVIRCQVLQCSSLLQDRGALLHFDRDGYISAVVALHGGETKHTAREKNKKSSKKEEKKGEDDNQEEEEKEGATQETHLNCDLLRVSGLRLLKDNDQCKEGLDSLLYASQSVTETLTLLMVDTCEVAFSIPAPLVAPLSRVRLIRLSGLRLHNVRVTQTAGCELLLLDDVLADVDHGRPFLSVAGVSRVVLQNVQVSSNNWGRIADCDEVLITAPVIAFPATATNASTLGWVDAGMRYLHGWKLEVLDITERVEWRASSSASTTPDRTFHGPHCHLQPGIIGLPALGPVQRAELDTSDNKKRVVQEKCDASVHGHTFRWSVRVVGDELDVKVCVFCQETRPDGSTSHTMLKGEHMVNNVPTVGEYHTTRACTLFVEMDNSHSTFTHKDVEYRLQVDTAPQWTLVNVQS